MRLLSTCLQKYLNFSKQTKRTEFRFAMKTAPHQRLVMVGDRDGLKELLRRRLVECGWRDQVKLICKELIKEHGHDITYDKLLSVVTTKARTLVPDSVKKELLQKIKNQLIAQEEKLKM